MHKLHIRQIKKSISAEFYIW